MQKCKVATYNIVSVYIAHQFTLQNMDLIKVIICDIRYHKVKTVQLSLKDILSIKSNKYPETMFKSVANVSKYFFLVDVYKCIWQPRP